MKAHKKALRIFIAIGVISLALAIVAEWKIYIQIAKPMSIFSGHREFVINVALGLAGGCFIAVVTEWIFISVTIKAKIQNVLLQIRHIKSIGNKFYFDITEKEFLGVCAEIEQHFDLLQQDLDIYDVKFNHHKPFKEMIDNLCEYVGMIVVGKERVQYEKTDCDCEIGGIRSAGEIHLAQCIARWSPLVKKFSGNKMYQIYCDIDKRELALHPDAPTIAALEKEGKRNGQAEV